MREMNSDITESGDYKAVYYAKDFLGTGAELSFNFSVLKYSNEKSYQLMGNMTPVYLAINSVNENDVVESASHKVMFRDSEGNVSGKAYQSYQIQKWNAILQLKEML